MIKKILEWFVPQIKALNWWRIGGAVLLGLLFLFLLKFVWVGRPEEFRTAGYNAGMAAAQLTCEKEKKARDDVAQRYNDKIQKERSKIAARPRNPAARILERMYLGEQ